MIPFIKEEFAYLTSELIRVEQSQLDGTMKLLIKLQDGHQIESVIISHTGETEDDGAELMVEPDSKEISKKQLQNKMTEEALASQREAQEEESEE